MTKNYNENRFEQAARCLKPILYDRLSAHMDFFRDRAQEIRLRLNRPVSVCCAREVYYFSRDGALCKNIPRNPLTASEEDMRGAFQRLCNYSVYSRQNQIAEGFITFRGGHRAGICGTAVCENGRVVNVRDISSINIRVANQHIGCAEELYGSVEASKGLLVCGAVCSGKTTVLRDLARLISTKENKRVSLIDERGELAGICGGEFQNDIGMCDVFDFYPKSLAVTMAIRSMSPDVIICDELGSADDSGALAACRACGVRVVAGAHAEDLDDLRSKEFFRSGIEYIFPSIVFLSGRNAAGRTRQIIKAGDLFDC